MSSSLACSILLAMLAALLPVAEAAAQGMPVPGLMGDQHVDYAWELVDQGRFAEAEALLRRQVKPGEPIVSGGAVALEMIRRTRLEYTLTPAAMLEKIRTNIPDATAEDVERWRSAGLLEHRTIDGQVLYFRREANNLLRASEEARNRFIAARQAKGEQAVIPGEWKFGLVDHVTKLLALAKGAEDPQIYPVRHRIRYTLTVNEGHPRAKTGAVVRCWLPYPQEYRQQSGVRLVGTTPPGGVVAPSGQPQRTVYFEKRIEDPSSPLEFKAEFEFTTAAFVPKLDPALAKPADTTTALYREHTAERRPHIAISPQVREIVEQATRGETNPLLRARKLYLWCCENLRYCSELEYSTIRSISEKALTTRKGDCGVQALAFITLCRAAGIPARWQSGWETLPQDWNMHDWAEFYVEPWGWLPADPSYGLMKSDDPAVREFYFGHLDAYRMIVNLDYGRALHPPKRSFRSEPADFQRGEVEIDGHNLYFDEWDYTFDHQAVPPEAETTPAPAPAPSGV